MPDEDAIPLDQALIKVLASDTRMDILRLLRQRRMTVTELARALDLQKATVLEHLEKLQGADLIRRMEDERLWVYYELSRRGQKIVNPGRTRVMLIIGTALAAAVVAVALMLALQAAVQPAPSAMQGTDQEHLQVQLLRTEGLDGSGLAFKASANSTVAPRAYLVPLNLSGGRAGYPLDVARDGDTLDLRTASLLPPGDYRLVVVDAATGRANAADAPIVHIPDVTAQVTPSTWWRGVSDGNATVRVLRDGQPAEGLLTLRALALDASGDELTARVVNGTGVLSQAALDAAPVGAYEVRFRAEGANASAPLRATFQVRDPQVAVVPLDVRAGRATPLRVTVAAGDAAPALDLSGVVHQRSGQEGPTRTYTVTPAEAGTFEVRIGRLAPWTVRVHPTVDLHLAALPGPVLELTARAADGTTAEGVDVVLDGTRVGTTNATGQVQFAPPADGARNLSLRLRGGEEVHRPILVRGHNVSDPPRDLDLQPEAEETAPQRARVAIDVANRAAAPEVVTLEGLLNGTPVASSALRVPANGTARGALEAPTEAGQHNIVLRAQALPRPLLSFVDRTAPPLGSTSPPSAPPPPATGTAGNATSPASSPGAPTAGGATGGLHGDITNGIAVAVTVEVAEPRLRARMAGLSLGGLEPLPGTIDGAGDGLSSRLEGRAARTPGVEPVLAVLVTVALAVVAARRRR